MTHESSTRSQCVQELESLLWIFDLQFHSVVIFKQYSESYVQLFSSVRSLYFVPVFAFKFSEAQYLASIIKPYMRMDDSNLSLHNGIVITSQHTVIALHNAFKYILQMNSCENIELSVPIFTFGDATPKQLAMLLPKTQIICFSEAQNSQSMARLIVQYFKEKNTMENISCCSSLLILIGARHRMQLMDILTENQISFQKVIVYKTIDIQIKDIQIPIDYNLDFDDQHLKQMQKQKSCKHWWIFFSPNGVRIIWRYLCDLLCSTKSKCIQSFLIQNGIGCGSIGITTAQALSECGMDHSLFYPSKPKSQMLFESWKQCSMKSQIHKQERKE